MKLPRMMLALATAGVFISISGGASAADPQIRDAGGATAIKDSYLVVLKDTANSVTESARLARAHGGKVGSVWSHALRGFSVTMPEAAALALAKDSAVAFVSQNHTVSIAGTQTPTPSWGLDRIDQRDLPLNNTYNYPDTAGNGVTVYVIDTGIRITHTDFGGRASHGFDFIDNDPVADDCHGHGTHVAGTAGGTSFGVAKRASLVAVRVLNCAGSGTFQQVIDGVNWVAGRSARPAVANMSLGGAGTNSVLEAAVTNAINGPNGGTQFALAAGNSGSDACNFTPARTPAAITVGATDINDNRASFSNFGTCLDIFAPGVAITSAWITNDSATNTISGTSMASPHVAGAAALILGDNPTLTAPQVRDAMVAAATLNKVVNPGAGSPNRLLFVGAGTPPTCAPVTGSGGAIPDGGTLSSRVAVTGCSGNAKVNSTVSVNITHPNRNELVLTLTAPDGTTYNLKGRSNTFTVDLSSEVANGTWTLNVRDRRANGNVGTLNSWTLTV